MAFIGATNPTTGCMEWHERDEDDTFDREILLSGYGDMLHDTERVSNCPP